MLFFRNEIERIQAPAFVYLLLKLKFVGIGMLWWKLEAEFIFFKFLVLVDVDGTERNWSILGPLRNKTNLQITLKLY